jgi:hypothetical protein
MGMVSKSQVFWLADHPLPEALPGCTKVRPLGDARVFSIKSQWLPNGVESAHSPPNPTQQISGIVPADSGGPAPDFHRLPFLGNSETAASGAERLPRSWFLTPREPGKDASPY